MATAIEKVASTNRNTADTAMPNSNMSKSKSRTAGTNNNPERVDGISYAKAFAQ